MPSKPTQACCVAESTATVASIGPLACSRTQLPPSNALPVASVLAATSAPVNAARSPTSFSPALPAATSQP